MEMERAVSGNDTLYVKFYDGSRPNARKTKEEGRPIFDDVPYVQIMSPGNRRSMIDRPVRDQDKIDFAPQWDRFNSGEDEQTSGTPLAVWPAITKSQIEELKYFHVYSVEQLAAMADTSAQNFMGMVELRKKAKVFLANAADEAPLLKVQEELAERDAKIEVLEQNLAALTEKIDGMTDG